jgi:hypothetical protein
MQSNYHYKELIPVQNTSENNWTYQLVFDPHITSPPAIYTDKHSDTTTS